VRQAQDCDVAAVVSPTPLILPSALSSLSLFAWAEGVASCSGVTSHAPQRQQFSSDLKFVSDSVEQQHKLLWLFAEQKVPAIGPSKSISNSAPNATLLHPRGREKIGADETGSLISLSSPIAELRNPRLAAKIWPRPTFSTTPSP
jgi:hypothetical protein